MEAWSNWAGNQSATTEVVRATTAEEIRHAIVEAVDRGRRIRPIGSGHSFTPIGRPADLQLDLTGHTGVVASDAPAGLVTVRSGTRLQALNQLLDDMRLAMTNLGDIDRQTISGAISTGTHGTGARFGGLATQVRDVELVTAGGDILRCSPVENPEVFEFARLGLGALGVISEVTLQTVPRFSLRAKEYGAELDDVLEGFDELADTTDHVEFYWFPHSRNCLVKQNTRIEGWDQLDPLSKRRHWWDDQFMSNTLFGATVQAGRRVPKLVRPLARFASSALGDREYTDISHRVFVSPRRVRFVESEWAVPRESLVDVLRELVATVERSDWNISFPVEVRVAAADDLPLSTASGRASGYIAIHTPPKAPHRSAYFEAFWRIASAAGGRPHWGKLHDLGHEQLRALYPRFDDFVAMCDRLDPDGVFGNDHLDHLLGRTLD